MRLGLVSSAGAVAMIALPLGARANVTKPSPSFAAGQAISSSAVNDDFDKLFTAINAVSGDVSGSVDAAVVTGIKGVPIGAGPGAAGDFLAYDPSTTPARYIPARLSVGGNISVTKTVNGNLLDMKISDSGGSGGLSTTGGTLTGMLEITPSASQTELFIQPPASQPATTAILDIRAPAGTASVWVDGAGNLGTTRLTIGTDSIAIGAGASATASMSGSGVALGKGAQALGDDSVAVGGASQTMAAANQSVAIGYNANASNSRTSAIGYNAVASNTDTIAIGQSSQATSSASIAIGNGAISNLSNTLVFGSPAFPLSDAYFGQGIEASTPTTVRLNGTASTSTAGAAGGDFQLLGGRGSPSSHLGGNVILTGGPSGANGNDGGSVILGSHDTNQARVDHVFVTPKGVGIDTPSPRAALDVNGFMRLKRYANKSDTGIACGAPAADTDGIVVLSSYSGKMCICDGNLQHWVDTSDTQPCDPQFD